MFTIKICGITRPEDARAAAEAGADAIGLNFYPQSSRAIDLQRAQAIIAALPAEMIKVGLFVNAQLAEICRTYDALGLDLIQLHGDEPPDLLSALGGRPVMKAFRAAGADGLSMMLDYLETCRTHRLPAAVDPLGCTSDPRLRRQRQAGRLVPCQAVPGDSPNPHIGACRWAEGGQCGRGDSDDRGACRRYGQRCGVAARNQGSGRLGRICSRRSGSVERPKLSGTSQKWYKCGVSGLPARGESGYNGASEPVWTAGRIF